MHGSEAQGFCSWSTNEACLLLKAVQILGLLKLETRVHLAALKPESVSSQTALRRDCRHLFEVWSRGSLPRRGVQCTLISFSFSLSWVRNRETQEI